MNNSAGITPDNFPPNDPPSNSITENEPLEQEISVNLDDLTNYPSDFEFEPDDFLKSKEFPPQVQPIDNQLLKAAVSNKFSEVEDMVSQDSGVLLGITPRGSTCLHISSTFGHLEFSEAVLDKEKSLLSIVNSYGETPLSAAVTSGHPSLASALLKLYKQQNLREMILKEDNNKNNVLHHAIRNGHSELALELITAEPDLSKGVNKYNESPMYIVVSRSFTDTNILERLLKIPESADVGPNNENALHAAVNNGNQVIVTKILEKRSLLARKVDKDGHTPLYHVALFNKIKAIQVLLEHDCSLGYVVTLRTHSPLLNTAAFRGNIDLAQVILKYCPDAPYCDRDGWTMLHQAVNEGHENFVEFVIENPQLYKLINMRDNDGDTALHIAIQKCNPKIVRLLLTHNAIDLTVLDNNGNPPESELAELETKQAKTLNWNEIKMMMFNANPQALINEFMATS